MKTRPVIVPANKPMAKTPAPPDLDDDDDEDDDED